MLELEESDPNCPQLQESDVEGGLFLGPQATRSVMKEGAAPAVSGGIRVQQEIWRHVPEILPGKKIGLQHPPL